ncbi:MAG: glycosyltransferase family 2 protein [bacterium]|nr:glycosyltransferase family 2 protein [bacterium]
MTYVVVLGYHSVADIQRCVESLLKTNYPAGRWRIVVVDNDSRPETRELLASYGELIDVLTQATNTGYAGGMNIGIRHALHMGADFVVLLNQDTEVDPEWLTHLVMAAESDPRIGAVQPRIMLGRPTNFSPSRVEGERPVPARASGEGVGGEGLINSIGNHIHILGFGFAGGHRERWTDLRSRLHGYPYPEVTYPSGAAVLYRAKALRDIAFPRSAPSFRASSEKSHNDHLEELQYLDEDYFLYHEDLDIGVRLWMRGWRCVLAPSAVVTHHYEFSRSIAKLYWMERNRILFLLQNFRIPTLLLLAPVLMLSELGLLILAKRGGWLSQKLKAWRSILSPSKWGTYLRHRRAKQSKRMVGDHVVLARFTARLTNQEMPSAFVDTYVNPVIATWWRCVRPLIFW